MRVLLVMVCTLALLSKDGNPITAQSTVHSDLEPVVTFLSDRTGEQVMYAITPDGTGLRAIFGGPIKDVPTINKEVTLVRRPHSIRQSPDGKYFASCADDVGIPIKKYSGLRRPMLWLGDMKGSWTRVLSPDCTGGFAWSPDSTRIAYSIHARDHNKGHFQTHPDMTEICVCAIDGSSFECVIEMPGNWYVEDWSSDGERLLLLKRPNVMTQADQLHEFRMVDAANARTEAGGGWGRGTEWPAKHAAVYLDRVPDHFPGLLDKSARYSPDGKELAILGAKGAPMIGGGLRSLERGPCAKIGILRLSDEHLETILDEDGSFRGSICWSNDGSEILFSRRDPSDDDGDNSLIVQKGEYGIWAIDRDTKKTRFIAVGQNPDRSRFADR